MIISDILKAGEALTTAAPFLAGIQNAQQHDDALAFVEYLLLNDPTNPLLEIASNSIMVWERTSDEYADFYAEMNAAPTAVAVIRTLMAQHGLTLADFPEIGSKSMVSRVLNGQRKLTLEHARKLSRRFGLSPALFISV